MNKVKAKKPLGIYIVPPGYGTPGAIALAGGCVVLHNSSKRAMRVVIYDAHVEWTKAKREELETRERKQLGELKRKYPNPMAAK